MSADVSPSGTRFNAGARLLHWLMAVLVVAMLFIGIGMVSTTSNAYRQLLELHKPLGIIILLLVAVRLLVRVWSRPPTLPKDMPAVLKFAARVSHVLLYGLMFALPLVGWAMLSAGGYPIVLSESVHLAPIAPIASASTPCCARRIPGLPCCCSDSSSCTWRRRCFTCGSAAITYSRAWRHGPAPMAVRGSRGGASQFLAAFDVVGRPIDVAIGQT